jgi:UDP-glucose 6-dehydrogenase
LENKEPIYALILRTLSNILIHNTNKNAMLKHSDIVFMAINTVSKNSGLVNKNYLYAMAVFLYNFSVAILEKNL